MRVIKFMACDTVREKMWTAEEMGRDELTLNPDGRGFVNVNAVSPSLSQYMTHMIPLEFTGFKVKDNQELFEGHIVKLGDHRYVIVWDQGRFILDKIGPKSNIFGDLFVAPSLHRHLSEIEILGH